MAARKGPRRRRPTPDAMPAGVGDPASLPIWVEARIARGKLTEAEYREGLARRQEERREYLRHRVPPLVQDEGPAAVMEWIEEWMVPDPRRLLLGLDEGPRAPLTIDPDEDSTDMPGLDL